MKNKYFRIKVVHYNKQHYCIKYSNTFIPIWHTLMYWRQPSYDDSISEGWHTYLEEFNYCEKKAKTFKSIEDIKNYNKDVPEKIIKFEKERENWYKNNCPYYTKEIKLN
jgi:hypothetical protein